MLRFLNEALRRQSSEAAFCTVGCVRLDPAEGGGFSACLASGGHPYPLLVRAGGRAEDVIVRGTLLGVEREPVLEQVSLDLAVGDTLVLYTDGMTDARDPDGERFGEERLRAAIDAAAGGPAEARGRGRRPGGGGLRGRRLARRPRDPGATRQRVSRRR